MNARAIGELAGRMDSMEKILAKQAEGIAEMKEMLAQAKGGATIVKWIFGGSLAAAIAAAIAIRQLFHKLNMTIGG